MSDRHEPATETIRGQSPDMGTPPADPYGTEEFTARLIEHFHRAKRKALAHLPSADVEVRPVKNR
jgi:hypothetical protein